MELRRLDRTSENVLARLWNKEQCSKCRLEFKKEEWELRYLKDMRMILGKLRHINLSAMYRTQKLSHKEQSCWCTKKLINKIRLRERPDIFFWVVFTLAFLVECESCFPDEELIPGHVEKW